MDKRFKLAFLFSIILIINGCGGDDPVGPSTDTEQSQTSLKSPKLVSPSNSTNNHPAILALEWEEVSEADSYRLQISTNSDFSSFFVNESEIKAASKLINGLELDQQYYWRVKSKNQNEESDWSEIWSFKIEQLIETTDNTKLLSPDLSDEIVDTIDGLNIITFEGHSEYANNLNVGDIIMSSPSEAFPIGALRKVTGVNSSGSVIEFNTEQAVLEEAIQSADLNYEIPIKKDNKTKFISTLEGVKTISKVSDLELFTAVFDTAIIYQQEVNGTMEKIYITGNVEFKATLLIDLEKKKFDSGFERMTFAVKTDFDSNLKLGASLSYDIEKKIKVGEFNKLPIITVGPLVLKPEVELFIGAEGNITAGAEFGVGYTSSITAGLQYIDPNWSTIEENTQEFGFESPSFYGLKLEAEAKGYVGGDFQTLLYGVAGPVVTPKLFIEGNLKPLEEPWWSMFAGVEADASVVLEVLWKKIAEYKRTGLIGLKVKIVDSNSFGPKLDWNLSSSLLAAQKGNENLSILNTGTGELQWEIDNTSEWLEFIPNNGVGPTDIEINYTENSTSESRDTQFEIKSNGGYSGPIEITQEGNFVSENLIAYYPFNGNAIDETGNGFDGTVDGATLTTDRFNNSSNAYSFDGTNDLIYGNLDWGQATSQSTLSFWFKTTNSDNLSALVGLGNSTNDHEINGEVNKNIQGNLQFYIREREDFQRDAIYTNDSFTDGEWHHAVLVRNGSGADNLSIYIDNQLVNNITIQKDENVGDIFFNYIYMGAIYRGEGNTINRFFEGDLDDVRIYNYAISENEISELYSEGGYTPPSNDKEIAYETDFSSDPSYQIKYSSNTDGKADIYWDNENDNFYALVKDQFDSWYSLGISPTFNQTIDPKTTSFAISFKFNPIKPDWGHYPGIYFVKSDNSFPPNELQRSIQFTINWSDNTYKKFRLIGLGSSENYQYLSSTIPNENEWYSVKLEYNTSIGKTDLTILREDGSVYVSEDGLDIKMEYPFDQLMIGERQGNTKYGDSSSIRVDDISVEVGH